jgi:prepilin-type N-terminal cleavage/methylation domain-containing protein
MDTSMLRTVSTLNARRLTATRSRGFTIVELLVVISIIAVLLSLISIGLIRGGESSRQTAALSNLREVGRAWTLFANQNQDRCLPGYVDPAVQSALRVNVDDQSGNDIPPQFCATYPNRLLPFLDYDRSILYRYLTDYQDLGNMTADDVANKPAFGYNAYYVGGWYQENPGVPGQPQMRFSDTGYFSSPGVLVPRQEVVARSVSQIQRPSSLITFSASTRADPGFYKEPTELADGAAWVVPHTRATQQIWKASDGGNFESMSAPGAGSGGSGGGVGAIGNSGFEVFVQECVPLRRIQNLVTTVRADGSTATQGPRELMDQSRWINVAHQSSDPILFTHP